MDGYIGALRYFNVYIRDFDYADPSGGLLYFHTGGSLLGARPKALGRGACHLRLDLCCVESLIVCPKTRYYHR